METTAPNLDINQWFEALLQGWGVNERYTHYIELVLFSLLLIILCIVANFITKRIILKGVERFAERSKTDFDNILVERKVFLTLSQIVPALLIKLLQPYVFHNFEWISPYLSKATNIYIEIIVAVTIVNFVKASAQVLENSPQFKDKPVQSFRQLAAIIVYVVLGILVLAEVSNVNPMAIVTGLGAVMVVIVLVFKDTLLGFVASMQIASNNMLRTGDWVSFEKFGADGNVLELNLTTVKIQNWDKTISTVPTYAFISEAFKNWRGMEESGGRRIKRSIRIDMTSVKFMDEALVAKTSKFHQIADYVKQKNDELTSYNEKHGVDDSILTNGRRMTNLGTFRAYVETYLQNKPEVNHDMTFLVRQLAPGDNGVPIEIYLFVSEQSWNPYERIQGDIFDHIIAVVPEFELRIFQNPTGADFREIRGNQ